MSFKIGIDVGGTFTDFFLWSSDGTVTTHKTLSTPEDPSIGVVRGLSSLAEILGLPAKTFAEQITTIVHGTTVTTNATLTRRGAKTALLTTEGVRDALEMRRGIRERQYDNRYQNVVPLVPRYLRQPVAGRLDREGRELAALDEAKVRSVAEQLAKEKVDAVAICFMNAFADPKHERRASEIVSSLLPEAYLSVSSEVLPTVRFYNRLSTTVINAYVGPILRRYLRSLTSSLSDLGFGGVLLIMQSGGGVAVPEATLARPAATLLSGPAGGPGAAAAYSRGRESSDCIVVDMGGTSFDASLVRNGRAAMSNEGEIDRLRIALPMLDITTIGAGGGSIGWIDEGGLLRMGPDSAGAAPGPACYGRGGEKPTCTDANVVLGYLDPAYFAGGKLPLDLGKARTAVEEHIAKPLAMSTEEAAAGMYRVINTNMAHGVREITVKRGLDPREFPLVIAGGAGALHACMIARELEIEKLIVPNTASVLCATGMLMSDLQHDYARSYVVRFSELDLDKLRALVGEMVAEGDKQLSLEGIPEGRREHRVALDLRYVKQYHEVTVWAPRADVEAGRLGDVARIFHAEHNRLYGYDLSNEGTDLELINVRVSALGRTEKPSLPRAERGSEDPGRARKGERRAFVPEKGAFLPLPVFDGHLLLAGNRISGPALIERSDTTIVVTASFDAHVDDLGSCVLTAKGEA